jgi:hypothetical protein
VGWPSVRGERAVVMVRHNGGGDDYFRRGSTGVVVGSDEGGGVLRPLRERKRCREAAATVVSPRKMIGRGPHVCWARRGVNEARGEAFPSEGGGKRAGRHRLAVIWAERVGWASREAEAQWREGE